MTIRCTVCGDDFKAWTDGEEVCPVCKTLIAGERRQAEAERTCPQCGAVLPAGSKGVFCSKKCRTASYDKTRRVVKCAVCGADMPARCRLYCSDSCRKKGAKIKAGKAAVKTDSFAEYESAAREAKKAGKWLSYGDFVANKYAEREKTVIGGKSDDR